ncbi:hypothetical protein [Phaeacidiphilus oryzae]|uniref:hypothetical protein n=1 Tax=Phaeacidiphilus oryzae TaxID=348818 RepID=UPI0005679E8A|nr:hypothetical protein [Phaeacidiphilus oryzae]
MKGLLKAAGWAALLLALAYPHAAGHLLAGLTVIGTVLLGHFVPACVTGAVLLIATEMVGAYRRRRVSRELRNLLRKVMS